MTIDYTPNFNDPRVRARARKALAYACGNLDKDEAISRSQTALDKRFGHHGPLTEYLRSMLLICVDHHYSDAAGIAKKYVLNVLGANTLCKDLYPDETDIVKKTFEVTTDEIIAEYQTEFLTGEFKYTEKSDRYWHDIQFKRKVVKHSIFAKQGYNHEYDIRAAAQTLLYQHALTHGLTPQPAIQSYIDNRAVIRDMLAHELNTTPELVKKTINALTSGAKVGVNDRFKLFNEIDCNVDLMNAIMTNKYLCDLRASLSEMWRVLPITDRRKCREKSMLYFSLEKSVINEVKRYLKSIGNKHFTEHDGWVCQYEIDEYQLLRHVLERTGYSISVSHAHLDEI